MSPDAPDPQRDAWVDALVDQVLGEPRYLTRGDVARAAGVSIQEARRMWRALGFADVGEAREFTDGDKAALRLLVTLVDRGTLDRASAVDVVRSLGQTTSRLSRWQLDTITRRLGERGRVDLDGPLSATTATALRQELAAMLPVLERLLVHVWRRELAAALEQALSSGQAVSGDAVVEGVSVGFADLVGFTELARRTDEVALVEVVGRFEYRAAEVVAAGGGRLVKTLGDEVLWVAADPVLCVAIAAGLRAGQATDPDAADLRIGLATGPVAMRHGDVFGTTVNLASRLTAAGAPGEVLLDRATATVLEHHPGYAVETLEPRTLRGIGEVVPYRLVLGGLPGG